MGEAPTRGKLEAELSGKSEIIVLGAGVVGVTTAWELARRGHSVTVIDRHAEAAAGASHANGAQISPSEAVPWASPSNLRLALAWMRQADGPFKLRLKADSRQWWWLTQFLANCREPVWRRNAGRMVRLARASQDRLDAIVRDAGIAFDREQRGILRVYESMEAQREARGIVDFMSPLGVGVRPVDADEILEIEPALGPAVARGDVAGGLYAEADESGDAQAFTQALARDAAAMGARLVFGHEVERIETHGDRFHSVIAGGERFGGDRLVICLGLDSPRLTRTLGFDLPIYPLKGYSATLRLAATNSAPRVSVTNESRRMVVSRLGDRIRVAGKADLVGHDEGLDRVRAGHLVDDLKRLYPELSFDGGPAFWTGLRPMTPTGVPIIGPGPVSGVYLNTGHGSLGWTMACGSAALLADLVEGRRPSIDPRDYDPRLSPG